MLMMVDAYEPLGVTRLSVDSIFMMPHLGVLSTIDEKAAIDVFVRDCMVYLGTCVAPIGQGKDGERCLDYAITFPAGRVDKGQLSFGDLRLVPLASGQKASIAVQPAKQVNLGAGAGVAVTREVQGGVVGLLLDGRGRPLQLPTDHAARAASLTKWYQAVDLYPKAVEVKAKAKKNRALSHCSTLTYVNYGPFLYPRLNRYRAHDGPSSTDVVAAWQRAGCNWGNRAGQSAVARAELPGKVYPLNLANQLGVAPDEIHGYFDQKGRRTGAEG